jgi:mRNA interferase RelE/StbE
MNYEIIIEKKAEKQILSFDKKIALRIIDSIDKLKNNPRPHGSTKLQVLDGYRIKVGDYRILYTINDFKNLITIFKISIRASAYN